MNENALNEIANEIEDIAEETLENPDVADISDASVQEEKDIHEDNDETEVSESPMQSEPEDEKSELEALRSELTKLKEELEVERSEFEKHKEKELEIARREANAIVKRVTAQSEKLIDELDEIRKQKEKSDFAKIAIDAKHKSKSTLNQLYNEANPITTSNEEYVLPRPLVKGDNVIIADMNKKGIVVTPPDDSGNCFIQAGIMKTKIHVSKLRLVEKQSTSNNAPKKQKGSGRVTSKGVESKN